MANGTKQSQIAVSPDTRGIKLAFGSFGLKSETQARVKSNPD